MSRRAAIAAFALVASLTTAAHAREVCEIRYDDAVVESSDAPGCFHAAAAADEGGRSAGLHVSNGCDEPVWLVVNGRGGEWIEPASSRTIPLEPRVGDGEWAPAERVVWSTRAGAGELSIRHHSRSECHRDASCAATPAAPTGLLPLLAPLVAIGLRRRRPDSC